MKLKRVVALVLFTVFVAAPVASFAKADDVDQKIDSLQKQLDDLKGQLDNKQGELGVMKAKFPIEFYGFLATQLWYGTAKTGMYTTSNSTAAESRVLDKSVLGHARDSWFSATVQNSRIGFRWLGTQLSENVKLAGIFEMDFLNVLNNTAYGISPLPRIRLFSFDLDGKAWQVLFGQNWDIFSPLNTNTLSLGGNLWFQGNMGVRRPQIRFTYNMPVGDINNIKFAVSANHPANTDDLMNGGVDSGIPYGEALVQFNRKMKNGDLIVAVSGVGGDNRINSSNDKTLGLAGSLSVPFHKLLKVAGEVQYGQDLGNFLTYAGVGSRIKNLAIWGQVTSSWCEKFETNVGYAIDDMRNKGNIVVGTAGASSNISRNQIAFGNFKYWPVKPFYLGLEYNYMRTTYKNSGSSGANVIFSDFVYTF